jgi:uncharacterized protein (TIGR02646 family)
MIKRSRVHFSDEPSILKSQSASKEYNTIRNYYSRYGSISSNLFKIYKHDDVKDELNKLFNEKCAYCETHYKTSGDLNIEHYRPKSEVKIEENNMTITGYWWLASEWSNLLPSCKRCNSLYTYFEGDKKITLGKGNYFPISNINYVNRKSPKIRDELIEEPLLINPTVENPINYLEFIFQNNNSIVCSKSNSLKGMKSIQHYGLNRPELVKERSEELKKFADALINIDESIKDLIESNKYKQKKKFIVRIKKKFLNLFENYIDIERHSYIQAKVSYLVHWVKQFDENQVNKILKFMNIK